VTEVGALLVGAPLGFNFDLVVAGSATGLLGPLLKLGVEAGAVYFVEAGKCMCCVVDAHF